MYGLEISTAADDEQSPVELHIEVGENGVEPIELSLESVTVENILPVDYYEGDYTVEPSWESQELYTKNLLMLDDVTVSTITVSQVDNPAGGQTLSI